MRMMRWLSNGVPLVLGLLLLQPAQASATCGALRPLCSSDHLTSAAVFDGTVTSIEPFEREEQDGDRIQLVGHRLVTFAVHEVWKGVSGDRVQVLLYGGLPAGGLVVHQTPSFEPRLGQRYVIFASPGWAGFLTVEGCGRSTSYRAAVEVLEYLRALNRPPSGGRLFGSITTLGDSRTGDHIAPRGLTRLTLSGGDRPRTIEIEGGDFEFGGLAPGTYTISFSVPQGTFSPPPHRVTIETARSCVELPISLVPDTRIAGAIISTSGGPVAGVRVTLADAANPLQDLAETLSAETDEAGEYAFIGVAPGRYVVGVNLTDTPDEYQPYARAVYPLTDAGPFVVDLKPHQTVDLGVLLVSPALPLGPKKLDFDGASRRTAVSLPFRADTAVKGLRVVLTPR